MLNFITEMTQYYLYCSSNNTGLNLLFKKLLQGLAALEKSLLKA
jgi:hypothetical protein